MSATPEGLAATPASPFTALRDGVRVVVPGALPDLWKSGPLPQHYCILGAGKTAMDTGVWLLEADFAITGFTIISLILMPSTPLTS